MLTTSDILKKVRELEIKSKKLTRHLFTGEYHSAFKGRGMLFKEVREYQHGDDIRFIDWNVSARLQQARKKDLITEIAAVLAFSAISNNDKVGMIFYSDTVEKFIPPKKGRDHVLYMVRELLTAKPKNKSTQLGEALRRLNNATKHQAITFVLSDFIDTSFADAIKVAGRKHDVIGIKLYDKLDMELPEIGLVDIVDPETGKRSWLDTNSFEQRQQYQEAFFTHTEWCKQSFVKAGADLLHIRTDEDYVKVLQKFFIGRNR